MTGSLLARVASVFPLAAMLAAIAATTVSVSTSVLGSVDGMAVDVPVAVVEFSVVEMAAA